jgi:hypothetical protein
VEDGRQANVVWQTKRKKEERMTAVEVVRQCRGGLKKERNEEMED